MTVFVYTVSRSQEHKENSYIIINYIKYIKQTNTHKGSNVSGFLKCLYIFYRYMYTPEMHLFCRMTEY